MANNTLSVGHYCDCKLSHRGDRTGVFMADFANASWRKNSVLEQSPPGGEGNLQFGPRVAAVSNPGQPIDLTTAAKNRDPDLNGGVDPKS